MSKVTRRVVMLAPVLAVALRVFGWVIDRAARAAGEGAGGEDGEEGGQAAGGGGRARRRDE